MLNYVSTELWRMTRRRGTWLLFAVYLFLVAVMGAGYGPGDLGQAMGGLLNFLVFGLYLCLPLAALANGDAGRLGTLRNEVSCGLTRGHIYLYKLLAGLIAGLVLFVATAVVFLATGLVASAGRLGERALFLQSAAQLGKGVLIALPRYFGALGLAHMLCFTLRTGGVAATLYYLYITLGELLLSTVYPANLGTLVGGVRRSLLSSAFFVYMEEAPSGVGQSWLVGLGWLILTTALGMLLFQRREIR